MKYGQDYLIRVFKNINALKQKRIKIHILDWENASN
jgi:hypothetical protein